MKNRGLISVIILVFICSLVLAGFSCNGGPEPTTTTATTAPVTTTPPTTEPATTPPTTDSTTTEPTTTTPPTTEPTTTTPTTAPETSETPTPPPPTGGELKLVLNSGSVYPGFYPWIEPGASQEVEIASTIVELPPHSSGIFPSVERLVEMAWDPNTLSLVYQPVLCESYEVNAGDMELTFNIREGIQFHDGSGLNADVVLWNLQLFLDGGWLEGVDDVVSMDKVGEYTVVVQFSTFSDEHARRWGLLPVFSQQAWVGTGGTGFSINGGWFNGYLDDPEYIVEDPDFVPAWLIYNAMIAFAVDHIVGTGPFMIDEYRPDVDMTWVRNPDYWREDMPYLDGIKFLFIPDQVTAVIVVKAREADIWMMPFSVDPASVDAAPAVILETWIGGIPVYLLANTYVHILPLNDSLIYLSPESIWLE